MPCPRDFEWDVEAQKCYSSDIWNVANWTAAVDICKEMYPGARLIEPRNGIENKRLQLMAGI